MATGGMRFGAGRQGYRVKAEQLPRINISDFKRRGYLHSGAWFAWRWSRGDEPAGSISVRVQSEFALRLIYTVGTEGERRDASQTLSILHTPCYFGAVRPWFACPVCHARVGVIYCRWDRFACRTCQRVGYSSQSDCPIDRTWRKQRKAEAKLGEYLARPKGMRMTTYQRLRETLMDCEKWRNEAFGVRMESLFHLLNRKKR